jgi:UDP-glucose 4-epimerase
VKIVVSGGAGFIGSHIVDAYVAAGHDVAIIDDLSTGQTENLNPQARFHQVDLRDRAAVAEVIGRERPEIVNHHAAQLDVRRSVADPPFDAQVNLVGFLNLLEASRQHGLRRVIFASSGGVVYGESARLPTREEDPTEPISPYGVAKLASERYLHFYAHVYGIPSVWLRYANVYGPRQNPHGEAGVISIFSTMLLAGGTPVINGSGNQTRDYVFVGDVVRANLLALESDYAGPLNIGTGVETDVNRLFLVLCDAVEHHPAEQHGPAKAGEQLRSVLDPRRAGDVLGWQAETPLAEGLRRTVTWFREHRAAA